MSYRTPGLEKRMKTTPWKYTSTWLRTPSGANTQLDNGPRPRSPPPAEHCLLEPCSEDSLYACTARIRIPETTFHSLEGLGTRASRLLGYTLASLGRHRRRGYAHMTQRAGLSLQSCFLASFCTALPTTQSLAPTTTSTAFCL
jgi:hypothetical protein